MHKQKPCTKMAYWDTIRALSSKEVFDKESQFGAHNYHPIPVALSKGKGVFVWDVDGKQYYDFLAAYSGKFYVSLKRVISICSQAILSEWEE